MAIRESSYGYWSSDRGFLWVAAGAAIGLGNIVRLPYLAGEYGGVLFLGAYVLALALVCWPLLVTEWLLGRWARADVVSGLRDLSTAATLHRAWTFTGWCALGAAVLILSYFSVIAGWSLAYTFRAASGSLAGADGTSAAAVFFGLAQDPERSLAWHTLFMVMTCIVVAHGVREGIERAGRLLVPAACVIVILLFAYSYTVGNSPAALAHLLGPDWSRFGWRGAMEAVSQAFFTMAVAVGAMFAFGSYLRRDAPVAQLAVGVIVIDTLFSLVAGSALYAMVFAAGLDPAPGITLLFQTIPRTLPAGFAGVGAATGVYLVLFLTTLIAAVALIEPAVRYLMERFRLTRVFAATSSAVMIWFIGLGTLLSFNVWQGIEVYDRNWFEWMQWLTGRVLIPVAGLLTCVLVSRGLPVELLDGLWPDASRRTRKAWRWMLRYPARIALILVLLYGIGAIDALVELFG